MNYKEQGRKALEAIYAHMENVREEEIDMGAWCGTTCCAIGHCINLPEVQATGLEMRNNAPSFGDCTEGARSIAAAFGIPNSEVMALFVRPDTKAQMMAVLGDFLACTEAVAA